MNPLPILTLLATVAAESITPLPQSAGRILEVPEATYERRSPTKRRPLKRAFDLFQSASRGEGSVRQDRSSSSPAPRRNMLVKLPWQIAPDRASLVSLIQWQAAAEGDVEMVLGLVLVPGQAWCSPDLDIGAGSRLRFEAISLDSVGAGAVEITQERAGRRDALGRFPSHAPGLFTAASQTDVELGAGKVALCFGAVDGVVGVGEPRVLEPEAPASDPRPRWIALTIIDDLRSDVLAGVEAKVWAPQLAKLSRAGHWYRAAISPGCHSRAAVPQILTGRDMFRLDPRFRQLHITAEGPSLEALYSRGNLMISQLAENAGYHSVFLGNNGFLAGWPAFSRASIQDDRDMGTVRSARTLPALFERYSDERVMLTYYVSAPHGHSATPKRLFEEFNCSRLTGIEAARCAYAARVRHGDEGLAALETGLEDYGLHADTLRVVTADHGEAFHDGPPRERLQVGVFEARSDEGHGCGCGFTELAVPLLMVGPGLEPAVWPGRVSTLDIVPTILDIIGMSPVNLLDGVALPLIREPDNQAAARSFLSYGFCNTSLLDGSRQFLWWQTDCARRRSLDGTPQSHSLEVWQGDRLLGTDSTAATALTPILEQLKKEQVDRVPSLALVLDSSGLPPSAVTVTALQGRIKDYGPSAAVDGFSAIRKVRLTDDARSVRMEFDGYRGLYYVATNPPDAAVTVHVATNQRPSQEPTPFFVGPHQLPVHTLGRPFKPREDASLLLARATPPPQPGAGLRLWWQPHRSPTSARGQPGLSEMNRVLREWGYVR